MCYTYAFAQLLTCMSSSPSHCKLTLNIVEFFFLIILFNRLNREYIAYSLSLDGRKVPFCKTVQVLCVSLAVQEMPRCVCRCVRVSFRLRLVDALYVPAIINYSHL